jgi:EAL domain-containing protein (putative c-di-GMP-specific phosphodiesterase class I)
MNANCFHIQGTTFALIFNYINEETAKYNLTNTKKYLDNGIEYRGEKISGKYIIVEYVSKAGENSGSAKEFYERLKYASSIAGKSGRSYIKYTDDIGSEMLRRRYIIDRLETIDRDHGYEVWLQPIFCLRNSKFCSSEALIRLREPDGRLISPGEFIPIAEQTGDINKITWFVVEEVCAFLEAHPEIKIAVSINLPMAQMLEEDFEEKFNGIIDGHGISHRQICIEFTERSIYRDYEQLKAKMDTLTKQGYRFYLDDFGAGYSNFSCLLKLPFEIIKLDANITNTILTEDSSNELVSMLTKLFHSMNLTVVAEGVETEQLVEALKSRDIDRIQGYYYARPMTLGDIQEFYSDKCL